MTEAAPPARPHRVLRAILLGGAVAGAADILYAFAFFGARGAPPERILQSIASGLLGQTAYAGGTATALLGLVLHFGIATVAAATFVLASRRLPGLVRHPFLAGAAFGLGVFVVMNFVVVPLSAFPRKVTWPPLVLATSLAVHMYGVGVPIAWFARAAHRPSATA
jgi:uncharacterized membrane protein YagU involved in acid resistance